MSHTIGMIKHFLIASFFLVSFLFITTPIHAATESVADRVIVKWKTNDSAVKQVVLEAFQARVEGQIYGMPVDKITVSSSRRDQLLERLKQNPNVEYAELDYIAHGESTPNDPSFTTQYHLIKIHATEAWDFNHGDNQVIAVIDTGIQTDHPEFVGKIAPGGWDFINNDTDPTDDNGHGTFNAGITSALTNNGIGIASVGYNAKVLPIKVLDANGYGSYSAITGGINYAVGHGEKIINLSLGGVADSVPMKAAIDNAWNSGAVIVAAAGNGNTDAPLYPAAYPNVISVSGTDQNDQRWAGSNYGTTIDIGAPADNIYSTTLGSGYTGGGGTSFASPQVAGAVALVWAQHPTWTNAQVRAAIENSADNIGDPMYFGHGRLNIVNAIQYGSPTMTPTPSPTNTPTPTFTPSPTPTITSTPTPISHHADTVGTFRSSAATFFLRNSNTAGYADSIIVYGIASDKVVVGDWNGDGKKTVGIYRNGMFYLKNTNAGGNADIVFAFGQNGDLPVAGDWNGDGIDTIGIYRNGTYFLRNSNTSGAPDATFLLGTTNDLPITGDWNGDHTDTTGVFRPSNGNLYLKNANTSGYADIQINYGLPGDKPVTGDWDGNGTDTIGVYRNGIFYLRNSNTSGYADLSFSFGTNGDDPIAGDWDGQ